MSIIHDEFSKALNESVKRKHNNTKKLKHKAGRVTKDAPEVMVKVASFGKGASEMRAHLMYIAREENLPKEAEKHVEIENERGEIYKGKDQIEELAAQWGSDFDDAKRKKNQRDSMHVVLSMPPGTEPLDVRSAARAFAKETFGKNHQYVFALHEDSAGGNPHVHLVVKMRGHDGKQLHVAKGDPQVWREAFAQKLRHIGVEAEATPRKTRGILGRSVSSAIHHLDRRAVSRRTANLIKSVAEELTQENKGETRKLDPQRALFERHQAESKQQWLKAADALESTQPITFKGKEISHERNRPNYEQRTVDDARASQRRYAKHLPKPNAKEPRRQAPTQALASVRNLSGLDVVHDRAASKVLLSSDARNRLGHGARASDGLRRAGIGDHPNDRGAERLTDAQLAQRIRGFVAAMPAVETERDRVRRSLVQQFGKKIDKAATINKEPERKKGAETAPKARRSHEPER